jgi:Gpi18-like mannosyltransferase
MTKAPLWNIRLRVDLAVIAMVLLVKAVVLVYGLVAFQTLADEQPPDPLSIWNRWDTPHYLDLAREGYQAADEIGLFIVFYPLYPLLIRIFALVASDYLVSAFLVSTVASIAAAVLLARLVQFDDPPRLALSAVWFLLIYPTSFFLHIAYTESLFLALTLGAFVAARQERWLLAGVLGGLASLTRVNGLFLLPALAAEAWSQAHEGHGWRLQWAWIGLVPAGFAIYLLINYVVTGDPLRFASVLQDHWYKTLQWPHLSLASTVDAIFRRTPNQAEMLGIQEMVFVLIGLAGTVASFTILRPSYSVWMAANWLVSVSTSFILSTPRYTLVMFPLFILLALLGRNRYGYTAVTVWSLLFLSLFAGEFVQGRWAF